MPRPRNTEERRTQIIAGLQQVMAARGYEGASVVAIAEAASITPGLVHYHFRNKQEILLELLQALTRGWSERAASGKTAGEAKPREQLRKLVDAWLALDDRADPSAVACWVTIGAEAVRQSEVRDLYVSVVTEARSSLETAVTLVLKSENRSVKEARNIATGLMCAIEGYFQIAVVSPGTVPRGTAAGTAYAMAIGAIDAQPPLGNSQ